MKDHTTTVKKLKDRVRKFREERGWGAHHTPKNLAVSIAIEAAELLEHFQWDDYRKKGETELAGELADVLTYCLFFADVKGIDIAAAVEKKLRQTAKKYPVGVFHRGHDDPKDYWRIKEKYRRKKT